MDISERGLERLSCSAMTDHASDSPRAGRVGALRAGMAPECHETGA